MSLSISSASLPQPPFAILSRLLVAAFLFSGLHPAAAQMAGTLKPGYNPSNVPYDGPLVSTVQADGKIVLGSASALLRLDTDGSRDTDSARRPVSAESFLWQPPDLKTTLIAAAPSSSGSYSEFLAPALAGGRSG